MHYLNKKEINLHLNILLLASIVASQAFEEKSTKCSVSPSLNDKISLLDLTEDVEMLMQAIQKRPGMYTYYGHENSYLYLIDSIIIDMIRIGSKRIDLKITSHGFEVWTDRPIEHVNHYVSYPVGKSAKLDIEHPHPDIKISAWPSAVNALCHSLMIVCKVDGEYKTATFRYGILSHYDEAIGWMGTNPDLPKGVVQVCHGVGDDGEFYKDEDMPSRESLTDYLNHFIESYPEIQFTSNHMYFNYGKS